MSLPLIAVVKCLLGMYPMLAVDHQLDDFSVKSRLSDGTPHCMHDRRKIV